MREEILTIDKNKEIIGIKTIGEQSSIKLGVNKPMILLSHAGLLHRVGPYRQWVDLARLLSEDGFTVFRFDFNSLYPNDSITQSIDDFIMVMNYLERNHGAKDFVIIGLCSGAIIGHFVALKDKRVVGTILIDGFGYKTLGWYIRYYLPRLIEIQKWHKRFISLIRNLNQFLKNAFSKPFLLEQDNDQNSNNFPSKKQAQIDIQQLVDRGVNILFIYSSGLEKYLNYANQFQEMFPHINWKNKIQVQYYPEADHMFTQLEHRSKLHQLIRHWMKLY